jgi:hypothetical protein
MDIGKAFAFVFEDDQWITKILLAAAILLLGIVFSWLFLIPLILALALLAGYGVEITRQVIRGHLDGLPEWDNWGDLFMDGVKVIVIGIVYALPIWILTFCLSMPIAIAGENAEGVSAFFGLLMSCLTLLWVIVMTIVLPGAIAFYVATDELSAAFRFGEVFSFVWKNLSTYLITFLMSWAAEFIGGLGFFLCGLGWLVTLPYSWMVTGHLYGQAYVVGSGQPLPSAAEQDVE